MSRRNLVSFVVAGLLLASASTVHAQRWYAGYGPGYGGFGGSAVANRIAASGFGSAAVIGATGQARLDTSRALINYEQARAAYIDNKLRWAEMYFQRQEIAEAERAEHFAELRERRDAWRNTRTRRTETPLNPSQLDPTTGKIYWPSALEQAEYRPFRRKLEELFVLRANTESYPGLDSEIWETTNEFKEALKDDIRDYAPHEYIEARKFVDGLALASRYGE